MSTFVFFSVLFAAFIHALWNAAIKFIGNRQQGMMLLSLGHLMVGIVMVASFPAPARESWPFLAGSVAFRLAYKFFLALAYERGDLSRVYPLSRGAAPLMILISSYFIFVDAISPVEAAGIIVMGLGAFLLTHGVFRHKEDWYLIVFALLAAVGTAGYSICDGLGARVAVSTAGYVGWLFVIDPVIFITWTMAREREHVIPTDATTWVYGIAAGATSVASYWIVIWAMTTASVALVTAIREMSVLFAVFFGVMFFGERAGIGKVVASVVIVMGVAMTRM